MKKIAVLVLIFLFACVIPAIAETAVAGKVGYLLYDERADSPYEGNNLYDSEITEWGFYVRQTIKKYMLRLDIDRLETGNTFKNHYPLAYEKVAITQTPIILSIGKYLWKDLYGFIGAGVILNEIEVEKYAPYPHTEGAKDSFALAGTVGYDFKLGEHFYIFPEGRYLWAEDMQVTVNGNDALEDNVKHWQFTIGAGWRW